MATSSERRVAAGLLGVLLAVHLARYLVSAFVAPVHIVENGSQRRRLAPKSYFHATSTTHVYSNPLDLVDDNDGDDNVGSNHQKGDLDSISEAYDGYSRDMKDQIIMESSEYQIVDLHDRNDGKTRNEERSSSSLPVRILRGSTRLLVGRPFRWMHLLLDRPSKPGKLILLRCGQSVFNANGTFTGWADVDLTQQGIQECQHAARLLLAEGYTPDLVYTSRLKRSIRSARIVLQELQMPFLPVFKSVFLNERSYGAATGLSKAETAERMGASVVQAWRNTLKARPPPMSRDDPYYPGKDRRYIDLKGNQIPLTESLKEAMKRSTVLWDNRIQGQIRQGNSVMVVGHGNTLRGLMQAVDDIDDRDILHVNLPTGIPVVYHFDTNMKPLPAGKRISQAYTNAIFLEKPGLLEEAMRRQDVWKQLVPGFEADQMQSHLHVPRDQSLVSALQRLRMEQEAERVIAQVIKNGMYAIDSEDDSKKKKDSGDMVGDGENRMSNYDPLHSLSSSSSLDHRSTHEAWDDDPSMFEDWDEFSDDFDDDETPVFNWMNASTLSSSTSDEPNIIEAPVAKRSNPVVVFVRHGRTLHNKLGLFTGWEDPPLAPEGIEDARRAGRILREHGFEFDVVYTSWLGRAIDTAMYVLDELDSVWVQMIKSWRLNERMYGALTGKSKAMIANEYGEEQLKKWRRGFKIRPPPVSSYSLSYPGNDLQRTKYVKDLRISWTETINRSIEQRKLCIHRKFPKTESLHDCMKRSIPFYTERIVPEAVDKGKRVLIASHENAIRGILMHLCQIPEEAMNQLHIPNGVPLVYDVQGKCISLLDDVQSENPIDILDFGPAAKYLFKPCELPDSFFDKVIEEEVVTNANSKEITQSGSPSSQLMP